MKIIKLEEHLQRVAAKARELDEAGKSLPIEAMRNSGSARTEAKKILLERISNRIKNSEIPEIDP